uniref:EEF1A lysine methyltransferase 2 n=1 Tax=Sinocyclocheilus anshuiensis TaxID=1608454 RepID=A0A671R4K5_9TELE
MFSYFCYKKKVIKPVILYYDSTFFKTKLKHRDNTLCSAIWSTFRFGEESMDRVIRWMEAHNLTENAAVLDTGNGMFLVELAKHGNFYLSLCFTCDSQVADFLNPSAELKGFDVCIDKGTFDAISLSPEDREEAKKLYVNSLKTVMQPGGFSIITSCNWTKEQLLQIFRPGFELVRELPTPRFQFGGVMGNSVTALVFKKID